MGQYEGHSGIIKYQPMKAGDGRDTGSIPKSGRSPGVGNGHSLQYYCLENSVDRGDCVGYNLQGHPESDMTERLSVHIEDDEVHMRELLHDLGESDVAQLTFSFLISSEELGSNVAIVKLT